VADNRSQRKIEGQEDLNDDDLSEDEKYFDEWHQEPVNKVAQATVKKETRHSYRMNMRHFVVYLYGKQAKKANAQPFQILHAGSLKYDLDNVQKGKGAIKWLCQEVVALDHIKKARNPSYQPIDLKFLDPAVFLGHLLAMTNTKEKEFHKS